MAVQACDSYQHLGIIRSNHRLNMAHSSVFISKPNCGMYLPSGVVLALIWSLRVKKLFSFIQLSILYLPHTSMQILLFYSFILPYISHKMLHCFPSRLCAVAHSIHSVNSISMFTCDQEKKKGRGILFFCLCFCLCFKGRLRACSTVVPVWVAFISPISTSITSISPILPPSPQTNYPDAENPMWGWNQCCRHLQTITADAQRWVSHSSRVSLPPEMRILKSVLLWNMVPFYMLWVWLLWTMNNSSVACALLISFFI